MRLPLKPFFKWTSVLLALLAVTIVGGAIKELQEAALVGAHQVPSVPTVVFLGLYPTAETLGAQIITVVVLLVLALLQRRQAKTLVKKPEAPVAQASPEPPINNDEASEENTSRKDTQDAVEYTAGRNNNE